ncbi:MAG: sn-glycerol-3-phosphate ABC transporter ATP-binding protein UgpC [Desulfobacteraceae bacterium]|nr:MAG: sn-glycerol-3-phosphate ABC transporter ATP-binding protein UgpC [Desulfobacteraceae bacterium]
MANVELKNISKIYPGNVKAVNQVTITIRDKEFVILVGPSGCGKTTLLRMIAGLEEITSGELSIDGHLMNDIPPKNRDIAMVFQNYALYPHMTVYQNMSFGLKIRKHSKEEIRNRVMEAAQILNIESLLERRPLALSGGQRQRVAVGRAIVRKPKVFLFDEPLSNLDAKLRVQMRAEISALHTRLQATMIYVTHDQVEAMTMGDRIVILKDGNVQQIGAPLELYNDPKNKFVAGFIGSPPINMIPMEIKSQAGKLLAVAEEFQIEIPHEKSTSLQSHIGRKVLVGIRPEDLEYQPDSAGSFPIKAEVRVIEPLGAEIHLHVGIGSHALIARVAPKWEFKIGRIVRLRPDPNKMKFFDRQSEERIQNP